MFLALHLLALLTGRLKMGFSIVQVLRISFGTKWPYQLPLARQPELEDSETSGRNAKRPARLSSVPSLIKCSIADA
jgi:hypothetical protein